MSEPSIIFFSGSFFGFVCTTLVLLGLGSGQIDYCYVDSRGHADGKLHVYGHRPFRVDAKVAETDNISVAERVIDGPLCRASDKR